MSEPSFAPDIEVTEARWPRDAEAACALIAEYVASIQQPLCFEGIGQELAHLDTEYRAPDGGFYLAKVNGEWAGCCGFRPLPDTDHTNAAEMKRLFVRPAFRRLGLGHALAEAVRDAASVAGYSCLLLDTLTEMESARALYEDMGFIAIAPYTQSPIPGAHHLKLVL
jgi:putative acetyltransferase